MSFVRFAFLVTLLSAPSCSLFDEAVGLVDSSEATMTEPELRARLRSFSETFTRAIQGAADDISARAGDRAARRSVLIWKMSIITECRDAANREDPRAALSDCWTLCAQLEDFFEPEGDVRALKWVSEEARKIGLEASVSMEGEIREIAAAWLGEKDMEAAAEDIGSFAKEHPMKALTGRRSYDRATMGGHEFPRVDEIVKAGLSPFNFVGGIDRTAQAVHEFSVVADRFTGTVEQLPEMARWEAQLALYDFEDRETVVAMRESIATLAESSASIAKTADQLPADIQAILTGSNGEVVAMSKSLTETAEAFEKTVATTRGLATDLDQTLSHAESVVAAADKASGSFGRAGESWEGVFVAIEGLTGDDEKDVSPPPPPEPGAEPEHGFDVRDYGDAADRISVAAVELRSGIAELQGFLDGLDTSKVTDAVDATTETTLNRTSEHAVDLVDHITKRAAQLLGLVFVLGLVFLFVARRRS